jgi:hypothetical protein
MVVEMALVLAEHGTGVPLVVDQHPVGALGPDAADEPLGKAVRPRRPRWVLTTSTPSAANTASKDPANLESRSRIKIETRLRDRRGPSPGCVPAALSMLLSDER